MKYKKRETGPPVENSPARKRFAALLAYAKAKGEDEVLPEPVVTPGRIAILPTEKDYEKGYVKRFFVSRYDAQTVTEVTSKYYNTTFANLPEGLYKGISMTWYLSNKNLPVIKDMNADLTPANVNEYNVYKRGKDYPQLIKSIKDFAQFVR